MRPLVYRLISSAGSKRRNYFKTTMVGHPVGMAVTFPIALWCLGDIHTYVAGFLLRGLSFICILTRECASRYIFGVFLPNRIYPVAEHS